MFIQMLFKAPFQFLMICLVLVFSICLHEYFHAWMAYREGDYGATEFMTLNPLRQMGLRSLLMLAIIGLAWGAVPVDLSRLRSRWSYLKISLAGPAANFLLFLISALIFLSIGVIAARTQTPLSETRWFHVVQLIYIFGMYNFALLIFNLLPAPGLDGWNVLAEIYPKVRRIDSEFAKGAMLGLMILAFFGATYLFLAGGWLMEEIMILGVHLGRM
ncbi:MAG: site-2 protease family protein [Lentisphaeria bacterium]|nr:site-2 protease family protein [Lentisphaeria bacterium]